MKKKDLKLWALFVPSFKKLFVLLLLIIATLCVFGMCGCSAIESEVPTSGTEIMKESYTPTATSTSTPTVVPTTTSTSTPTVVPTITPTLTQTPIPYRKWELEQFERVYHFVMRTLLDGGYQHYDGYDVFDNHPMYPVDGVRDIRKNQMLEEYARNDNANFWCQWIFEGWRREFGLIPFSGSRSVILTSLNEVLGNPKVEPYCEQFDPRFYNYEMVSSGEIEIESIIIPLESYDWSAEDREFVINEYFLPITNRIIAKKIGLTYIPMDDTWYPIDGGWSQEELDKLPDSVVCWVIINHSAYALDLWVDGAYRSRKAQIDARIEVRRILAEDEKLAKYCPNIISMIAPQNYPPRQ